METKKKEMVRLSLDLPIEIHKKIRHIAVDRNCSIRRLALRALLALIRHEEVGNEKTD